MRLPHYEFLSFFKTVLWLEGMFMERIACSMRQEIRNHNKAESVKTDVEGLTTIYLFATYVHVVRKAALGAKKWCLENGKRNREDNKNNRYEAAFCNELIFYITPHLHSEAENNF